MKRKDILEKPYKTGGMLNAFKAGLKTGKQTSVKKAVDTWKSTRKGPDFGGGAKPKTKPVATAPGKPQPTAQPKAQPTPGVSPKPVSNFPTSKTGIQLKPGDKVTYQNAKGQTKDGVVTVMLQTRDRQGDLQIQLGKGPAKFAVDRQNIRTANGDAWEYDPVTNKGKPKESIKEGAEARIQHAEDLVFFKGSAGAMQALSSLKSLTSGGHKNVTLKWDGSPAVILAAMKMESLYLQTRVDLEQLKQMEELRAQTNSKTSCLIVQEANLKTIQNVQHLQTTWQALCLCLKKQHLKM